MRASLSPALLLAAVVLLAGCGSAVLPGYPTPAGPASAASQPIPPSSPAHTTETVLRIPKIGVDTPVTLPLGLTDVGEIEVPPLHQPGVLGEWIGGVTPGDPGVSVLLGHVSGRLPGADRSIPGVFARLDELAVGDPIDIIRPDGASARFVVARSEQHPKSRFPTAAVYEPTPGPELRLVSCTGELINGHFNQNRIVWAVPA